MPVMGSAQPGRVSFGVGRGTLGTLGTRLQNVLESLGQDVSCAGTLSPRVFRDS